MGILNNIELQDKGRKIVSAWLLVGMILVLGQIVVGGITRLTDSGLSITEWEVVKGTLPPLNTDDWNIAFEKYKEGAKHQYEIKNPDMTLGEFKVIYFWEWFHRFWARSMGLIFFFPFMYFLFRGYFSKKILLRLGIVILLAASAAIMGWLMVDSGIQNTQSELESEILRTRVSAYRLIAHLTIATLLFGYLWWTYLLQRFPERPLKNMLKTRRLAFWVGGVLVLQILLGGLMAGTKAGLVHPHFPFFVEGDQLYHQLLNNKQIGVDNFVDYEKYTTPQAWIQVFHRGTAYLLTIMILVLFFRIRKENPSERLSKGNVVLVILLGIQFFLGVITVLNSIGSIPVVYGVLHQAFALILFGALLYVTYWLRKPNY